MKIVIPLSHKDRNNFADLRYALRSLELHLPITELYIVGGKPAWLKNANHLEHPDYVCERKEQNIRDKCYFAAKVIQGDFLFTNDDIYLQQAWQNKVYNKGRLSDALKGRGSNDSYTILLKNTIKMFGDVKNTDCHAPLNMTTEGVEKCMFDWPKWSVGFKTCYTTVNKIHSSFYPDLKVNKIDARITGRPHFSTVDGFRDHKGLELLYPTKSRFE